MRSALEGAAMRVAPSMKAQHIANTLWALATLGWRRSVGSPVLLCRCASKILWYPCLPTAEVRGYQNDALEGPEVEYERWYELWELFPLLFLRMPLRGGRRGQGLIASRLDAHKQRNYDLLLDWYFSDREIADRAPRGTIDETRDRKLKKVLEHTKVGQYLQAVDLFARES